MKPFLSILIFAPFALATDMAPLRAGFVSTVQLAVREEAPALTEKSQAVIIEKFSNQFQASPDFQNQHFELRKHGNEIAFVMTSNTDMRPSVQRLVGEMIQELSGRVRAHGRTSFYRTALGDSPNGYLDVVTDETKMRLVSISAQSVPLRELLREMRLQMRNFSYLIPGECAEQLVDYSFSSTTEPKSIGLVMTELAALFSLKVEKRNSTFIYSGSCLSPVGAAQKIRHAPPYAPDRHLGAQAIQVYLPVSPIGE